MKFAESWTDVLTAAVTAAGIGLVWFQVRQVARQERLQVGHLYLQRFWTIDDELLEAPKGSERHRRARHRYLILTEDEFDAALRGWLEGDLWEVWHEWIASSMHQPTLRRDLRKVGGGDSFKNVRKCLGGPPGHSWQRCPAKGPADVGG